jgi:hypothetical protein
MQLISVDFHAFKSLLNKTLNISHNCMGFVGINESGKSNVLEALRVLGGDRKLSTSDRPKMAKENDAFITYKFTLNDDEYRTIQSSTKELFKKYIPEFESDVIVNKVINYNVKYDQEEGIEYRYFDCPNFNVDENLLILKPEKNVNKYPIKTRNGFKNLVDCLIIVKEDFQSHVELEKILKDISSLKELLSQKQTELDELTEEKDEEEETDNSDEGNEEVDNKESEKQENCSEEINNLRLAIENLQKEIKEKQEKSKDYKLSETINGIKKKNAEYDSTIKTEAINKKTLNEELSQLNDLQSLTAHQTQRI